MTKKEKLVEEVKSGRRISSKEAQKILQMAGFLEKGTKGDHQSWSNGKRTIAILLNKKELPDYLIDKLKEILEEEGL